MMILLLIVVAIVSYLIGSLNFAVIISYLFYHKDIRTVGSGNAGMTNMLRTFGKKAGAATFIGDALKAVVAIFLSRLLFSIFMPNVNLWYPSDISAVCVILGHIFPIYFKFKGGKGVACAAGAIITLQPVIAVLLAIVFAIVFYFTKMISAASIAMSVGYPICIIFYSIFIEKNNPNYPIVFNIIFSFILAGLIIYMHRSNISRIKNGEEYQFNTKDKKKR